MFSRRSMESPWARSMTKGISGAGDGQEVEGVERCGRGEARGSDAPLDQAPFAVDEFQFDQTQQVADAVDALLGALLRHALVLAQAGRQPQFLHVVGKQD